MVRVEAASSVAGAVGAGAGATAGSAGATSLGVGAVVASPWNKSPEHFSAVQHTCGGT